MIILPRVMREKALLGRLNRNYLAPLNSVFLHHRHIYLCVLLHQGYLPVGASFLSKTSEAQRFPCFPIPFGFEFVVVKTFHICQTDEHSNDVRQQQSSSS